MNFCSKASFWRKSDSIRSTDLIHAEEAIISKQIITIRSHLFHQFTFLLHLLQRKLLDDLAGIQVVIDSLLLCPYLVSKNFEMHRSVQTASPLLSSPALYSVLTQRFLHVSIALSTPQIKSFFLYSNKVPALKFY